MKYKLICIDMDGTLLNSRHRVTDENKRALKNAHDLGVEIVITTGRIYNNARHYSDLIGVKSPVVCANGALIIKKDTEEIIYKNPLLEDTCYRIIDILSKHGVKPHFHTTDKVYVDNWGHKVLSSLILSWSIPKKLKVRGVYLKSKNDWEKVLKSDKKEFFKCIVFHSSRDKLKQVREELLQIEEITVVSSGNNNLEINAKGVNKGEAIKQLAKHYNIDMKEVICIGDNENDISMIKAAGLGVAMGNAADYIKKEADYITDTNNNSGVAKVVNKFVLDNSFDL